MTVELRETREVHTMKMLVIQNDGEIETNALTLLGGSTKRGDGDKIGFFGSGNKYSLAYLLRNEIPFRIFSGEREIIVSTTDVPLGNQVFKAIVVDGVQTGLTTEAGPKWKAWEVFRELYCNALDEGFGSMYESDDVAGQAGVTRICIQYASDVGQVINQFDKYFTEDRDSLWTDGKNSIYDAYTPRSGATYRRGILCAERLPHYCGGVGFDFDMHDISVNESRALSDEYGAHKTMWKLVFRCNDASIIYGFAARLDSEHFYGDITEVCDEWLTFFATRTVYTVGEKHLLTSDEKPNALELSSSALKTLTAVVDFNRPMRVERGQQYDELPITHYQAKRLKRVRWLLAENGIEIPDDKIVVGDTLDTNILGMYCKKTEKIVISPHAFEKGVSDLAVTLLEEYIHMTHGVYDYSREFQDAALRLCVTIMQDNEGE